MSNTSSHTDHHPAFSFDTRLGLFVAFEAALISAVSVSILLCYTVHKVVKKMTARHTFRRQHSEVVLPPIDATDSLAFVVLMFGELIKAIGGLLDLRWVLQGDITEDSLCSAQGYFRQIGDNSVALFSLFIGFDTFLVIVFGWRASRKANFGALIVLVLFMVILVVIGTVVNHGRDPRYMGNTGLWCWIKRDYLAYQVSLEYLWMWTASLLLLILYGLAALVMQGSLVADGRRLRLRPRQKANPFRMEPLDPGIDEEEKKSRVIANLLLFYPAIYFICVLPISVTRWIGFTESQTQSPGSVLFASTVFELSGFFNVLLFVFTRPALVSARNLDPPSLVNLTNEGPIMSSDQAAVSPMVEGGSIVEQRRTLQGALPPDDEEKMGQTSPSIETVGSVHVARHIPTVGIRPHPASSSTNVYRLGAK